jgi:uncharacterized protein (TIGR02145 family)
MKSKIILCVILLSGLAVKFSACKKECPVQLATLTTSEVTPITTNTTQGTAITGGIINNDCGAQVIQRGVVWNTSPNPTTENSKTDEGSGTGAYVSYLTGLNASTIYYVRAYATNSAGTAYGNELSFTSTSFVGSITELNCNSVNNYGTLNAGTPANGVYSSVYYTGGNGGTYNEQTANSTGVTGLTATLAAGSFANGTGVALSGNGSLFYTITGTPNAAGTATFALNIGGQNCILSRNVGSEIVEVSTPGAGVTFNGYTYSTVLLGNGQEWMAENLQTANYSNGDPIPTGLDDETWYTTLSGTYAVLSNDEANNAIYGKLYNYFAVTDPRNVCPAGWHVPTYNEWGILIDYLGGQGTAGGKMKTTGTQYWQSPNGYATNESGFSGLPGGYRSTNITGTYPGEGYDAYFWSSTENNGLSAWTCYLNYHNAIGEKLYCIKRDGNSVRCLKD